MGTTPEAARAGLPETARDEALITMNTLWRALDELYRETASSLGLSESSFDILYALYIAGDGCLQRDICEQSYLGKQTVNSSIHKLVAQDLLRLEKAPQGRGKHVFLTEDGRRLVERTIAPVVDAEREALASLSGRDRVAAFRILRSYTRDLRDRMGAIPGVRLTERTR